MDDLFHLRRSHALLAGSKRQENPQDGGDQCEPCREFKPVVAISDPVGKDMQTRCSPLDVSSNVICRAPLRVGECGAECTLILAAGRRQHADQVPQTAQCLRGLECGDDIGPAEIDRFGRHLARDSEAGRAGAEAYT